jgi:peptidoglycan/LPS O-acetylase OafA/YrhL
LRYRADIDGLRAIAVLSVFAFHANIHLLGGGYVGVDIFFVISGYLISEIIFKEVDTGTFRLSRFYLRRVRRIIPALCVVTLAVFLFSIRFLYPSELDDLSKSAIASSLSASNIFFWQSAGYFDGPSNSKPLLHTWSLGVEEQFYILFPILATWIGFKSARWRVYALCLAMLASLGVSEYLALTDVSSAFYLPYSRFWELLLGSLLAARIFEPPRNLGIRELVAGLGLAMIAAAVLTYRGVTAFPGLAALLPCLGAAAIILSGVSSQTIAGRILALPPLAFIGLISYSLYLWHWPMIVFQRVGQIVHTGLSPTLDKALVVVLTFVVAFLSWRFIEKPFRKDIRSWREKRSLAPLAATFLICAISLGALAEDGWPARFSPESIRLASYLDYSAGADVRAGTCFLLDQEKFEAFNMQLCMRRNPPHRAIMLIGDSHAGHLYQGLNFRYGEDADILQATATGCKPLLSDANGVTTCSEMAKFIYGDYLLQNKVDLLVISARWGKEDLGDISKTLEWLKKRDIPTVLIGPTPEYDVRLPRLLAQTPDLRDGKALQGHVLPEFAQLDGEISEVVGKIAGIRYLSAYEALCPNETCAVLVDGVPVYYDTGHLTKPASIMLVERFGPLL